MTKKSKILLIEDDPDLGSLLSEFLKLNEFSVDLADTGEKAIELFRKNSYDLITIDIMLPDTDGYDLAKKFKASNSQVPFIYITAKNRKEEVIAGLKSGAQDYITKPFDPEELVLRIKICLRRSSENPEEDQVIGDSRLIHNEMTLVSGKTRYKLTMKEYQVLSYMILCKNKLIKREILLEKFWGENDYFKGRSMDVFVSRFRKYLSDDPKLEIETFRGSGYILREGG
jgi:DNA-binding response OmpR family regulator